MRGQSDLGTVLRIERSSIHDGNGFRTVVFLKGCPLRCWWCSTPESHSFQIEQTETNAYGTVMTVEEVMKEVRKDSLFYFHSGGGMTLSGGEPLAQPEFAKALLMECKKELINTAIETTFFAKWEVVSSVLPYLDTVFVDVKFIDNELHKKFCGVDNHLILDNLLKTNELDLPFKLVVRILIVHATEELEREVENTAAFAAGLKHLDHVQLLSYHRLGTDTYRKLGMEYKLPELLPPDEETMARCRALVQKHVKKVVG